MNDKNLRMYKNEWDAENWAQLGSIHAGHPYFGGREHAVNVAVNVAGENVG